MNKLDLRDLVVRYGKLTAVGDASFGISPGGTLGLVGESGSGKQQVYCVGSDLFCGTPQSGQLGLAGKCAVGTVKTRYGYIARNSLSHLHHALKLAQGKGIGRAKDGCRRIRLLQQGLCMLYCYAMHALQSIEFVRPRRKIFHRRYIAVGNA